MERCIIYLRQSRGEEDSGSIRRQKVHCTKKAEELGFEVAEIFKDENISGKTYPLCYKATAEQDKDFLDWFEKNSRNKQYREGISDAIQFTEKNGIKKWIVIDSTRIHRSTKNSLLGQKMNQFFVQNGIRIIQVLGDDIDLSSFDHKLVDIIRSTINDEQFRKSSTKSHDRIIEIKNQGILTNFSSFGINKNGKSFTWDKQELRLVKFCFKAVLLNISLSRIVRHVNDRYYANRKEVFQQRSLMRMLKNPVYILKTKNSFGDLIDIANAPIDEQGKRIQAIDDYTFYRVFDLLDKRKGAKRRAETFAAQWTCQMWKMRI